MRTLANVLNAIWKSARCYCYGGLSDSIVDYSTDPDHATGFLYQEKTTQGLVDALRLALETYKDKVQWQKMQENGMKTDFSWATSAEKYYQVYQNLMNKD